MAPRPSLAEWGLELAKLTATRATCFRRQVGCVLLDRQGRVLATGYNGVPRRFTHCTDDQVGCPGAHAASGTNLDGCQAIHAEQNALLQCKNVDEIDMCCVTTFPCLTCIKLLLNTPCRTIVFKDDYPHASGDLWRRAGRHVQKIG